MFKCLCRSHTDVPLCQRGKWWTPDWTVNTEAFRPSFWSARRFSRLSMPAEIPRPPPETKNSPQDCVFLPSKSAFSSSPCKNPAKSVSNQRSPPFPFTGRALQLSPTRTHTYGHRNCPIPRRCEPPENPRLSWWIFCCWQQENVCAREQVEMRPATGADCDRAPAPVWPSLYLFRWCGVVWAHRRGAGAHGTARDGRGRRGQEATGEHVMPCAASIGGVDLQLIPCLPPSTSWKVLYW